MHGYFMPVADNATNAPERKEHVWKRRELRALLQELAAQDGWLAREVRSDGTQWWLHAPSERGARPIRPVAAALVTALKEREFLTPLAEDDPLRWRISARGRRWLAARKGAPTLSRTMLPPAKNCDEIMKRRGCSRRSPPAGTRRWWPATGRG